MITSEMIRSEVEQLYNYVNRPAYNLEVAILMIDNVHRMSIDYAKQIKEKHLENIDIE